MHNYKLIIRYDGTRFGGWQIQKNAVSVQGFITQAIETVLKTSVTVTAAGRTDAGVHALGQVANFFSPVPLDLYLFVHQINGILPHEIAILSAEPAEDTFNARYSAKSRTYKYLFITKKNPFLRERAFFFPRKFDLAALRALSSVLPGTHDFRAFAKELPENGNCMCTVQSVNWRKRNDVVVFTIRADRFLHGMVRHIAGTLLNAQETGKTPADIEALLKAPHEEKTPHALPATGLYLVHVEY